MPEETITRERAALLMAQVYALVRACPIGRVTTYGAIGAALGFPRGARMIGWIMNETPRGADVPAQRVVSAKGELTGSWAFGQRGRMRQLLEAESVPFTEAGAVDMKRAAWDPRRDLSQEELDALIRGASSAQHEAPDNLMRLLRDDPASPFRITREQQP
ncbi:MAG TPA: MGMT family protein [Ktedonobacterales bacterium]|jgi:methylated-DNA-protein-cysteine methyltransferase-like protein